MKMNENLREYALPEIEHLQVHGRTTGRLSPLVLFWTGSGIELKVTGSELWIEVEVDYEHYEPWVSILVNGAAVSRQMLSAGRYWLCVFRGMSVAATKQIRVVRDVQAMSADPSCSLQIHAVKCDGQFQPVEEKPYKIEFIGDSITSGEGAIGAKEELDWTPMLFSAVHNYAALTAEALHAECRILSQSGWGVLTSWDNNPHGNLPDYYEQVCGLLTGEKNQKLGAFDAHDFTSWQPEVLVVNLGTNDGGAFHSPPWQDPATGETHKQRLLDDGSYHEEDLQAFEDAVVQFLRKLRMCNPQARIVWAYGMLGIPMMPAIHRAVDTYIQQTGDRSVSVFQLPDTTEETIGARTHPGRLAHERAAHDLSNYIRKLLEE